MFMTPTWKSWTLDTIRHLVDLDVRVTFCGELIDYMTLEDSRIERDKPASCLRCLADAWRP
jgi:hypothetical protein